MAGVCERRKVMSRLQAGVQVDWAAGRRQDMKRHTQRQTGDMEDNGSGEHRITQRCGRDSLGKFELVQRCAGEHGFLFVFIIGEDSCIFMIVNNKTDELISNFYCEM